VASLVVVHPDIVVRWHRQWLRCRWTRGSRRAGPGRPRTNALVRALVMKIAGENPLWGAPRIHGELGKLGVPVSERTVSRMVRRPRRPPSQTWRTFLTNHVTALASVDFFTVPTVTGRLLFVFVVLLHHRRRIVHFNVTEHPTAAWTAQQLVEAFPDGTAPRWVLRDRDAILTAYTAYYHGARTHLSLAKDAPTPRRVQGATEGEIIAFPEVGGLHHRYERRAA
jgi:putative transposase